MKKPVFTEAEYQLIAAGTRLSNICFNLSQHSGGVISPATAKSMREAQVDWDSASETLRLERTRLARARKKVS